MATNESSDQKLCKKRLETNGKQFNEAKIITTQEEIDDKEKNAKLIGQLKAAEARNRIRDMRLRYDSSRTAEVNHLISCQPSARKAVRLQALLPIKNENKNQAELLDKISRKRVQALLEDELQLLTI